MGYLYRVDTPEQLKELAAMSKPGGASRLLNVAVIWLGQMHRGYSVLDGKIYVRVTKSDAVQMAAVVQRSERGKEHLLGELKFTAAKTWCNNNLILAAL